MLVLGDTKLGCRWALAHTCVEVSVCNLLALGDTTLMALVQVGTCTHTCVGCRYV
jgi:hypothetical protein